MQSMGVRSVDTRITSLILDSFIKYGSKVPEGIMIRLPLSREGMANYIEIARETVSRKLSQMGNEGIVRLLVTKSFLL